MTFSRFPLGFTINSELTISSVSENYPAHRGGVVIGCQVIRTNGVQATSENTIGAKVPCKMRFQSPKVSGLELNCSHIKRDVKMWSNAREGNQATQLTKQSKQKGANGKLVVVMMLVLSFMKTVTSVSVCPLFVAATMP